MTRTGSGKDHFGYHAMLQSAQKGVVRSVLRKAVQLGALPGDHHFYITFRTRMPGVRMPDYLKDKFTEEMTIVIQHQYWDLEVTDETFSVMLKFGGQTERLLVPFAAISRFVDPSINFGMMFDETLAAAPAPESPDDDGERPPGTVVSLDAFRRK